ncbi:septation protein A [Sphingomonas sp. ABOLG]|uniref:Inner membrane-spanning protein YciB n=1 Tax=Sphingomonas olei TaxID=1886787 RepID=A0ABY2QGW3_9SPHN|nr:MULTISPECIES: septation protein A [Sphingomonas]MDF2603651.1 intracellular septation protein [Sphingomonas sp.]RSV20045.1 septation protein A [Sphingomonas sp. ABOLG]THG39563.1 septation protein A [Sphingomonas olei]
MSTETKNTSGLRLALDYGPLIVFFAVNFLAPGPAIARILAATAAFMIAMAVALGISWWKTRHIPPMLLISGALVIVFGGLTIWFQDERFIKMKPTFVYAIFAAVLGFGLATGRPLLQLLLESAYPGLTADGWRKLTRNWVIFFLFMAVLNEAVWRSTSTDFWVGFKLWGAIPLTMIFAIANVPMLMRHGLQAGNIPDTIPPQE